MATGDALRQRIFRHMRRGPSAHAYRCVRAAHTTANDPYSPRFVLFCQRRSSAARRFGHVGGLVHLAFGLFPKARLRLRFTAGPSSTVCCRSSFLPFCKMVAVCPSCAFVPSLHLPPPGMPWDALILWTFSPYGFHDAPLSTRTHTRFNDLRLGSLQPGSCHEDGNSFFPSATGSVDCRGMRSVSLTPVAGTSLLLRRLPFLLHARTSYWFGHWFGRAAGWFGLLLPRLLYGTCCSTFARRTCYAAYTICPSRHSVADNVSLPNIFFSLFLDVGLGSGLRADWRFLLAGVRQPPPLPFSLFSLPFSMGVYSDPTL